MIVMADEMIAWVKRFMQATSVDAETLALEVIDEVGLDDDFLGVDHTHAHFREDWYPDLFDRRNHEAWALEGGRTLRLRARAKVEEILENHRPEPLDAGDEAMLKAVLERGVADLSVGT
jgi:trimethylamine--corrinoid protein Co-methyltransferase